MYLFSLGVVATASCSSRSSHWRLRIAIVSTFWEDILTQMWFDSSSKKESMEFGSEEHPRVTHISTQHLEWIHSNDSVCVSQQSVTMTLICLEPGFIPNKDSFKGFIQHKDPFCCQDLGNSLYRYHYHRDIMMFCQSLRYPMSLQTLPSKGKCMPRRSQAL